MSDWNNDTTEGVVTALHNQARRITELQEEIGLLQAVINRLADPELMQKDSYDPIDEVNARIEYAKQFVTEVSDE